MRTILSHRYFYPILISIISSLIILRIVSLFIAPPGFFVDEAATGAHVQALLAAGTNAHNEAWPLFSASLGGGYTTPVYLYPLTAWAALFGTSEVALRAFSQFTTLFAIGLLAWSIRLWVDKKAALIAATVALALPWGWLQANLAWDPAIVPLMIAASFLCFSALLFSKRRWTRRSAAIGLPLLLVGLAYLYPPCRVTAPLLFLLFYGVLIFRKAASWRFVALSSLGAFIIAIPLALFMIEPSSLERSQALSVFSHTSPFMGVAHALLNLWLLISPVFLFMTGDGNLRHSTGFQGMLGFAAILPLGAVLYAGLKHLIARRPLTDISLLAVISGFAVIFGLLGSALTGEGQPHSLRAVAAWPFFSILITLGWLLLIRYAKPRIMAAAIGLFTIGTLLYTVDLFASYPERAASSFDSDIRQQLEQGRTPDYPQLGLDYYENRR